MAKNSKSAMLLTELKGKLSAVKGPQAELYSGIVFSKTRGRDELEKMFDLLEPAFLGGQLLRSVQLKAGAEGTLLYLYFGPDSSFLDRFIACVGDLQDSIALLPKDLVPRTSALALLSSIESALVTWTALVYSSAWKFNDEYLQAHLEFQPDCRSFTFDMWSNFPLTLRCNPRVWLTLAEDRDRQLRLAEAELMAAKLQWPDVIDAYIEENMFYSSLAAIDLLLSPTDNQTGSAKTLGKPDVRAARKLGPRTQRTEDKIAMLMAFLVMHHTQYRLREPLTQEQIEDITGWDQSNICRWIAKGFPGGMKGYKAAVRNGTLREGYIKRFPNGNSLADGIVNDPEVVDD